MADQHRPPSEGPGQDPTRRIPPPTPPTGADPTRRLGPTPPPASGASSGAWEGQADPLPRSEPAWDDGDDGYVSPQGSDDEAPRPRRVRRAFLLFLGGGLVGFVLAFVVVALGTGDGEVADLQDQQRIEALEADLAASEARIAELEAQLAEAEAAAGARDDDVEAQRQALDERGAALQEWEQVLAEREEAIGQRQTELAAREEAVAQREQALDDAGAPGLPDLDLPGIDDEDVDGFIDRILEQIRDLFG